MMECPLVSVVIPTYNSAQFLPATLESVLNQDYSALEIIVVDDGSTDETAAALTPYRDRIKYLRQENWGGPSRPRNVAVAEARGELIAFFDSDDLMLAGKISASVQAFAENPDLGLLFTNFQGIDEQDRVLAPDFLAPYREFRTSLIGSSEAPVRILPARVAYGQLLKANFIGTSSVMCRREILSHVGAFDEQMLNADDVDMWRRIAYAGYDFAFLNRVLHGYRKRSNGVTSRGVRRYPAILRGLGKQLDLELDDAERRYVEDRLHGLELSYGAALCKANEYADSDRIYRNALRHRLTWTGIKGWLKLSWKRCRG